MRSRMCGEQMLPIEQNPVADTAETVATTADYIFEPSREGAENIVPNTLKIQLYKALLDMPPSMVRA